MLPAMQSFDQEREPAAAPSPWVLRFLGLIPADGPVLDLACGGGRHTRLLLEHGFAVTAVDLHMARLRDLGHNPQLRILETDLEAGPWPFADGSFAGILVTNYLHRPHFPQLVSALRPGGVLLMETFSQGHERLGRPRNPDFLLAPGELLHAFGGSLQVVAFEQGNEEKPRPAVRQRLCAVRSETPVALPA